MFVRVKKPPLLTKAAVKAEAPVKATDDDVYPEDAEVTGEAEALAMAEAAQAAEEAGAEKNRDTCIHLALLFPGAHRLYLQRKKIGYIQLALWVLGILSLILLILSQGNSIMLAVGSIFFPLAPCTWMWSYIEAHTLKKDAIGRDILPGNWLKRQIWRIFVASVIIWPLCFLSYVFPFSYLSYEHMCRLFIGSIIALGVIGCEGQYRSNTKQEYPLFSGPGDLYLGAPLGSLHFLGLILIIGSGTLQDWGLTPGLFGWPFFILSLSLMWLKHRHVNPELPLYDTLVFFCARVLIFTESIFISLMLVGATLNMKEELKKSGSNATTNPIRALLGDLLPVRTHGRISKMDNVITAMMLLGGFIFLGKRLWRVIVGTTRTGDKGINILSYGMLCLICTFAVAVGGTILADKIILPALDKTPAVVTQQEADDTILAFTTPTPYVPAAPEEELTFDQARALLSFCDKNNPQLVYNLARCHAEGVQGVCGIDEQKAFSLFFEAAQAGHVKAQSKLGWCLYMGVGTQKNDAAALDWWRKAAFLKDESAMYGIGLCLESGQGIAKEVPKALRYYQKAAELGCVPAMETLGDCYHTGRGVEQNQSEAIHLWRIASGGGSGAASEKLASAYEQGIGVEKNSDECLRYLLLAANEQGNAMAQYRLGNLCFSGVWVPQNDTEAVKYYQAAAEQGLAPAQRQLGLLYAQGRGVATDLQLFREWITKAATHDDAIAVFMLGLCYERGVCSPVDLQQAAECYRKAAELGYTDAQFAYAGMLYHGRGVEQNPVEAVEWMKKAAAQGNTSAQQFLKEMEEAEKTKEDEAVDYAEEEAQATESNSFNLNFESEVDEFISALTAMQARDSNTDLFRKRLLTLLPLIRQDRDVDLTLPETKGNTALHYACGLGYYELIDWLLEHNADATKTTDRGKTPRQCISNDPDGTIRFRLERAEGLFRSPGDMADEDE